MIIFFKKIEFICLWFYVTLCINLTACSNPLLYGWLNDNFRKEFKEILKCCRRRNTNRASTALKLKAIDASFNGQKRALSDVGEIDKQSQLLLRPSNNMETTEMKSEYTV